MLYCTRGGVGLLTLHEVECCIMQVDHIPSAINHVIMATINSLLWKPNENGPSKSTTNLLSLQHALSML